MQEHHPQNQLIDEQIVQLKNQLHEIREALQGAEGRHSNISRTPFGNPEKGKGWITGAAQNFHSHPSIRQKWAQIEQPNINSLFRREFKIYEQINERGKGDQLSFVSLSRQIEGAIENAIVIGES